MGTNQLYLYSSPCRLCLNDDEFQLPIFEEYAQKKKVVLKIQSCLPILKVTEDDALPKSICYKCVSTLDTLYDFWQKCCSSETILRSRFNHNSYDLIPHQKAGYQIEGLGSIEYPPSAHYRMKFPRSVSQSTRIRFADSDSEDDWPILNSIRKQSKMCIPKSKKNFKQSNDNRLSKQDAHHSRESMRPAIEGCMKEVESKWKKQSNEEFRMDTSTDLLEIIERNYKSSDENDEVPLVERNDTILSNFNSNRITTISTVQDRNFVANFWRHNNSESHNQTEQTPQKESAEDNQIMLSPRSKIPTHKNVAKLQNKRQSLDQETSNLKQFHIETPTGNKLLHSNLVIPNTWLPEAIKCPRKMDSTSTDITEERKEGKNKNEDISHFQRNSNQSNSNALEGNQPPNAQKEEAKNAVPSNTDMSYLLMNIRKNCGGESLPHTRNVLDRFKTYQRDFKQ